MQEVLARKEILSQLEIADSKAKENANDEAISIYDSLLDKTDDLSILGSIYSKLGDIYYKTGNKAKSIWAYENALNYREGNAVIYNRLGYMYFYLDSDKSIENYLKGMEFNPDIQNFVMLTQIMIKSTKFRQKDLKQIFEKYIDIIRPQILKDTEPYTYQKEKYDKNKKIKLGYLSSDFYNHAMMSFVLPIIENHDFNKFDITLYHSKDNTDFVTERLKETGVKYKNCSGMTNAELAKTIHEDKIDILVDLSGYTHNAVLALLYKPAPIIVQYLGFLGTYGMTEVDYIFADKFTIPWYMAKYYTEKPVYIKGGMNKFTFQIKEKNFTTITALPYEKNGYITFGCFNSMGKINSYTIALWSKVLQAVPNSKLLIYRTQMEQRDIERFTKEFTKNGIDLNRIIFDKQPTPESHMNSYLKCDFALDPIPFSGLTITIEQAFMGVPVLTLPGETIASKGTARVNKALGLNNFIAKNEKDYIKKAVKISSDIEKLRYYRKYLHGITRRSYLCNNFKKYTQEIEKQYIKAWKKFCRR